MRVKPDWVCQRLRSPAEAGGWGSRTGDWVDLGLGIMVKVVEGCRKFCERGGQSEAPAFCAEKNVNLGG